MCQEEELFLDTRVLASKEDICDRISRWDMLKEEGPEKKKARPDIKKKLFKLDFVTYFTRYVSRAYFLYNSCKRYLEVLMTSLETMLCLLSLLKTLFSSGIHIGS